MASQPVDFNRKDAKAFAKNAKTEAGVVPTEDEWSHKVIGAGIEVHRALGPGLLESVYQECLAREFTIAGIPNKREVAIPVEYKGINVDCGFRPDFVVDSKVIVELKAVENVLPVHRAQLLTYLKLTGCRLGLLINFNVPILKEGIERIVLGL